MQYLRNSDIRMMKAYCFALLLLLTLPVYPICAQDYRFKPVTSPAGNDIWQLVTDIAQDAKENLWLATWNGLYKYDGSGFVSYKPNALSPSTSISVSDPQVVFASRKGHIWVGSAKGLDRLDPRTGLFTQFRHNPSDPNTLPASRVNTILEDREGNTWIGTDNGLSLFNEKMGNFFTYRHDPKDPNSLSNSNINKLYEDKQGVLWVGTGSTFIKSTEGGLNRFDKSTKKFTRFNHKDGDSTTLIDDRVSAIFEDSRGVFWVGTGSDGLHIMDRSTGLFKRLQYNPREPGNLSRSPVVENRDPVDHITFITEDAAGIIWIGTQQGGLTRYDPVKKQTHHFNDKGRNNTTLFQDKRFWRAFNSKDGLLWMSTWEGHLYKIDPYPKPQLFIPTKEELNTVFADTGKTVWFGTQGGLLGITGTSRKVYRHEEGNPNSLSCDSVICIMKDHEGKLWIGTEHGLNFFDPEKNKFKSYQIGSGHNGVGPNDASIIALWQDAEKNIWAGTINRGLNRLKKDGTFDAFINDPKDSSSLSIDIVSRILEDSKKRLWVGTYVNGGLNLLDKKTGRFSHYLPGFNITAIYQDKSEVLWIGTEGGLFFLDERKGVFTEFRDPSTGNNITGGITAMTEDDQHNLWIRTRLKIIKISSSRNDLKIFGKEWGIEPSEAIGFSDAGVTKNGSIIFNETSGYYSFLAGQLVNNTTPPQLTLTELRIHDKIVSESKNGPLREALSEAKVIRLAYNQNIFSLRFKSVDYRSESDNQFLYMLENFEDSWRSANAEQSASYFNVPPGKYNFRVKVSNSDGLWSERSVAVVISPPWWKTWWAYALYVIILLGSIWSFVLFRSRAIRRQNILLEGMVSERTLQLKQSLENLQATQAQLIQSEKMASLGELTAGIAHEIQNPLNFVNNFSEVNNELLEELKSESPNLKSEEKRVLLNDIYLNNEKIKYHGKRADAIVKNMLQHSRASTGKKEATDINALADEYLRLAYHGLRAKDKSFNAKMETSFDNAVGKINIIPQEIGRVLLNLINNAFYAVNEKQKRNIPGYEPTVNIKTKKAGEKPGSYRVEITVADNGNGIPQKILDKIFQPFFTTKPAGEGTGLGLSLAYDIVKAHGGEIKIESKEGEGSEFTIIL